MVRRVKEEQIVGVLEFAGRTEEDPEFVDWLATHRADKGGKIRVSKGSSGVRVAFARQADMTLWQARAARSAKPK